MGSDQLAEESDQPNRSLSAGNPGYARTSKIRAFFGLPLPEAQRATLDGYLAECARLAPQFRWVPNANLHLTIRFLGHVDSSVAEQIADRLVAADLLSFDLRLGEIGSCNRGRLARVVWLGIAEGVAESQELATTVESECVRAGLEPETRAFSPHLTLARARARDGSPLPELPAAPSIEAWRANKLILYQSRLARAGAVYEPLRTIKLR